MGQVQGRGLSFVDEFKGHDGRLESQRASNERTVCLPSDPPLRRMLQLLHSVEAERIDRDQQASKEAEARAREGRRLADDVDKALLQKQQLAKEVEELEALRGKQRHEREAEMEVRRGACVRGCGGSCGAVRGRAVAWRGMEWRVRWWGVPCTCTAVPGGGGRRVRGQSILCGKFRISNGLRHFRRKIRRLPQNWHLWLSSTAPAKPYTPQHVWERP